jgi:hypothetical protein
MDSAKRCRDQSDECLRAMQSANSETEARILKDMAQSWLRIANQTERYVNFVNRVGPHRPLGTFKDLLARAPSRAVPASISSREICRSRSAIYPPYRILPGCR